MWNKDVVSNSETKEFTSVWRYSKLAKSTLSSGFYPGCTYTLVATSPVDPRTRNDSRTTTVLKTIRGFDLILFW